MATYFVISDIHSFYDEMIEALTKAKYNKDNPNHVLISCGDLLDRGPDSVKCLEFINSIPETNKVLIRGNHEYLLEEYLNRGYYYSRDIWNGTVSTAIQIAGSNQTKFFASEGEQEKVIKECKDNFLLQNYLQSCIDYLETDTHVFVHGWIPCSESKAYKEQHIKYEFDPNWRKGDWYNASWVCCFDAWNQGIVIPDKTIVAGHWHTSYGHSKYHHKGKEFDDEWLDIYNSLLPTGKPKIKSQVNFGIFKDEGIIGLDACTVKSHQINVLKIGKQKKIDEVKLMNQVSMFEV